MTPLRRKLENKGRKILKRKNVLTQDEKPIIKNDLLKNHTYIIFNVEPIKNKKMFFSVKPLSHFQLSVSFISYPQVPCSLGKVL